MKKTFSIVILGIFLISMMNLVAAAPLADVVNGVQTGIDTIVDSLNPVLKQIVGENDGGDIFLAKILFLIIIFAIAWKALERIDFFSENEWILWTVSVAVSILAIRWIGNTDVVNTILLPYSAFGVAIMSGLPFVLYFLIVKDFNRTIRKVSWIFFIVVFVGLWIMRSGEAENTVGKFAYVYLATAGLALAVLLFDGTIQKINQKIKAEKAMSYKDLERKHRIMDDLEKARNLKLDIIKRKGSTTDIRDTEAHITKLEEALAELP